MRICYTGKDSLNELPPRLYSYLFKRTWGRLLEARLA